MLIWSAIARCREAQLHPPVFSIVSDRRGSSSSPSPPHPMPTAPSSAHSSARISPPHKMSTPQFTMTIPSRFHPPHNPHPIPIPFTPPLPSRTTGKKTKAKYLPSKLTTIVSIRRPHGMVRHRDHRRPSLLRAPLVRRQVRRHGQGGRGRDRLQGACWPGQCAIEPRGAEGLVLGVAVTTIVGQ